MDLRRSTTCTPLSLRAELHHSSQPCDQWGRDSVAKLLSILITDTTDCPLLLSPCCPPEAERERLSVALLKWICDSVESRL